MADSDSHRRHKKHKHKHKRRHTSEDYDHDGKSDRQSKRHKDSEMHEEHRHRDIRWDPYSEYIDGKDKESKRFNQSDTSESRQEDDETIPDYDFNWEQHRYTLNQIFFTDADYVKRGTETYDDFWAFLKKYCDFQRKKAMKQPQQVSVKHREESTKKLDLPRKYDKRYRINISLPPRNIDQHLKEQRHRGEETLTRDRVAQFKQIMLHYLDFAQKQKYNKLVKIRKDQHNLPIYQYKEKIIEAVRQYQVVVVAGDTGCGKSTQTPQYLLEAGFEHIACTQPRRIACISLSKRVAYETLNEYGSQVAFQVRFEKSKTRATKILFLTEGLLLRQMATDPLLSQYSVIVIDEVHERHIHTDFLLGVLKCLLRQKPDLKLVLMSATININLFSDYFDQAPVLQVPGRLYPIELEYCPLSIEEQGSKTERLDPRPYVRILQRIDHKYPDTERGDVLIFLSGMKEIMSVVDATKAYAQKTKRWIILALHSSLSVAEQDKVFDFPPEGIRKCIISTNIAETSVTIDGVRFVVDSGKVKEMSFDPKCKMQRLQEFWISRASAEQRKGRAGRTGPGVCFRLYNDSDYNSLQDYSTPEIQRVPLDSLILQMCAMGLPDPRRFPFLEAPSASSVETSIAFLKEQGALTESEKLTPIGQMLSQLPVDVVIGKMLIMGALFHMMEPVLTIAAALSVQSPFTSRAHTDYDAVSARKPLESDHGDPFTLINAFDEWIKVKTDGRNTRKWCRRRGLEEQRFYEMSKLKTQFKEILKEYGLLAGTSDRQRYYNTYERQKRHAETKKLRKLKRDQKNQGAKRKILKFEDDVEYEFEGQEDEGEDTEDLESNIKDLEFKLTHDLDKIQETSSNSQDLSRRDISLLKIIICSGLFPQVAISDEHNSYKPDSEQAFHTKSKPFVLLHPTGYFASHPEVLELDEKDIVETGVGHEMKGQVSAKHQLLAFVSLLETTKPYLVGCLRSPALQTLLLYSSSLDTNTDCTRILCDGWLELRFMDSESAEEVLSSAVQLRSTWQALVQTKLEAHRVSMGSEREGTMSSKARKLESLLAAKLTEFLESNVVYGLRRVLAAETNHLYRGPQEEESSAVNDVLSELTRNAELHPTKGGMKVNEYLTFNCLQDDGAYGEYTTYMQRYWTCPKCNEKLLVTVVEKLQHEQQCSIDVEQPLQGKDDEPSKKKVDGLEKLRKDYHCDKCDQDLHLTTTEILKHKRNCKNT